MGDRRFLAEAAVHFALAQGDKSIIEALDAGPPGWPPPTDHYAAILLDAASASHAWRGNGMHLTHAFFP